MIDEEFRDDSLMVILTNNINRHLTNKQRAVKISKCCKLIRDRTTNDDMRGICRTIISATQNGNYDGVILTAERAEIGYRVMHMGLKVRKCHTKNCEVRVSGNKGSKCDKHKKNPLPK